MYSHERYEKILISLKESRFIKTTELLKSFNVSFETIRRDLVFLEKEGLIKRIRGGAVLAKTSEKYPAFTFREKEDLIKKQEIASSAISYIKEGNTIALDCGTTTLELVKKLKDNFKKLTVITSSLKILNELSSMEGFTIICAGGIFKNKEFAFLGKLTEEYFLKFRVDISFISASGISLQEGITDIRFDELQIQKTMLKIAANKIILAPSPRFEKICLLKICQFDEIDMIITDSNLSGDIFDLYSENKIKVVKADPCSSLRSL